MNIQYKSRREDKFASFSERVAVDKKTGCWNWTGRITDDGYGAFICGSSRIGTAAPWLAHRFSYMMFGGTLDSRLTIDHLCKNRKCVNPRHIEQVSMRVNNYRGNGWSGINYRKTHCKHGHILEGRNLGLSENGRFCKECARIKRKRQCRKRHCLGGERGHYLGDACA